MAKSRYLLPGLLLILAGAFIVLARRPSSPYQGDIQEVWFEDIQNSHAITASDGEALAQFVTAAILRREVVKDSLPEYLREDKRPRLIFLSVSDGNTPAHVFPGSGIGIANAIKQAISETHTLLATGYQPEWLKIDIVQDVIAPDNFHFDHPLKLERSLYGMAFDRRSGIAFLPEELVAYTLVNKEQNIRSDNITEHLERCPALPRHKEYLRLLNSEHISIFRFTTNSFFCDGEDIVRLYRGHRLFARLSRETLLSAAISGGQYLTQAVGAEGKFAYIYWPKTDRAPEKYNILRHAGAVYAMMELYELTGDARLLQASKRALGYLLSLIQFSAVGEATTARVVDSGYTKLGGNALAAIALAKYMEVTRDQQYMPVLLGLGRWIQNTQSENGEFTIHKQSAPGGKVTDFVSKYYPGEALLAMTKIHALAPDKTWLDTAEAGARYLINERDGGLTDAELSHDHWLLYALNELYRYRPKPLYLSHALRIARAILQSQNRQPAYPDWRGSFHRPPRSTPTATRLEGLCAAYLLAKDFGHLKESEDILKGVWLCAEFQLQTQFRPESVMYLSNPQRALGGFHRSLANFEIRIDYVQHNISGLLSLYRITGDWTKTCS